MGILISVDKKAVELAMCLGVVCLPMCVYISILWGVCGIEPSHSIARGNGLASNKVPHGSRYEIVSWEPTSC